MAPVEDGVGGARLCLETATRVVVIVCSCPLEHIAQAAVCPRHAAPPPSNAQCRQCGNLPTRNETHRCGLTLLSNKSILEA